MTKIKGFQDTINWYDQNASTYAKKINSLINWDEIDYFLSLLPPHAEILDAGCAAGRDCQIFFDKGYFPVGVDLSSGLLNIARKNHPQIKFIQANFLDLPFEKETFDGVWAHASLLHLETLAEVTQALKEFNRVLKPRGILHVSVKQKLGQEDASVVKDKLSNHERFFRWFTPTEIKQLVLDANFNLLTLKTNLSDAARPEVKWISLYAEKLI